MKQVLIPIYIAVFIPLTKIAWTVSGVLIWYHKGLITDNHDKM